MRNVLGLFIFGALVLVGCADSPADGGGGNPGGTPTPTPAPGPAPTTRMWVSADTHIHATGCGRRRRQVLGG